MTGGTVPVKIIERDFLTPLAGRRLQTQESVLPDVPCDELATSIVAVHSSVD